MNETHEKMNSWVLNTVWTCRITDLKAICKNRQFPAPPKSGPEAEDHVGMRLLGESGLESVYSQLDDQELRALHALVIADDAVEIMKIYPFLGIPAGSHWSDDIKRNFNTIMTRLVQKGLVFIRPDSNVGTSRSKWSQYTLYFPKSFREKLPALPFTPVQCSHQVTFPSWEEVVVTLIQSGLKKKISDSEEPLLNVSLDSAGYLCSGKMTRPSLADIFKKVCTPWLQASYKYSYMTSESRYKSKHEIIDVRQYLIAQIPKGSWIKLKDLAFLFRQFGVSFSENQAKEFINLGSTLGVLAQQTVEDQLVLSFNVSFDEEGSSSTFNLRGMTLKDGQDKVLVTLGGGDSLESFLMLAKISFLELEKGKIFARPDTLEMGRKYDLLSKHKTLEVIASHSSIYSQVFADIEQKRGKIKIHENLSVIKLNSPDVEAILLAQYQHEMVDLGEGYYAISNDIKGDLMNHGKKKGFPPKLMTNV